MAPQVSSALPPLPGVPAKVAASKALSMHNALEAPLLLTAPSPPEARPANQKRHIRTYGRTHTCARRADAHGQKFTNQKVYFLEADSQEKSSWKKLE